MTTIRDFAIRLARSGARMVLAISISLLPLAAQAGFYDGASLDQGEAYGYLDGVEGIVGSDEFDTLSYDFALAVAVKLGRIDRWYLRPELFVGHVKAVEGARGRFYRSKPLTNEEVKVDLLPFRIRYESTANAGWFEQIQLLTRPIVADARSADEAAKAIFNWISKDLRLIKAPLGYPLTQRGDKSPIDVLNEGSGSESDIALTGVAALRASGVLARIVWAPALRGEEGGKVWLEYLSEERSWVPWIPSFGECYADGRQLPDEIKAKIVLVMARPDAPVEVTDTYVETVELNMNRAHPKTEMSLMVFGKNGLMPARGNDVETAKDEVNIRVGRGLVIAAAAFDKKSFALLPMELRRENPRMKVTAEGGELRCEVVGEK